jgi:hypothetical protein
MPMQSRPIVSSMIASAGYDADTRVMEIEFRSGKTYTFEEVPPYVFENLLASDSPGRYFNENVKGVY